MQANNVNPPPWYQALSAECRQALAKVLAGWNTRTGLQIEAAYNFVVSMGMVQWNWQDQEIIEDLFESNTQCPIPQQE